MAEYRATTDEGAFWRDDTPVYTSHADAEDYVLECWVAGGGLEVLDLVDGGGTHYVYVLNEDKGAYVAYSVYFDEDEGDFMYSRAWERDLDPL